MTHSLDELRREYNLGELSRASADPDPLRQFARWLSEAQAAEIPEPNAMTLATADRNGLPSARIVLLKGCDERGLVFFTNYQSAKGRELADNPYAAVVFLWKELERQVRATGTVGKISREESAAYFRTRPRASRIGVLASNQSRVVADRGTLDQRFRALESRYAGTEVPMPEQWGGYRLVPSSFEFWQGRPSRLHDRLRYRIENGTWLIERLEP